MQILEGKVISNKMKNTVAVAVDYFNRHRKYKKMIKRTTKILAHHDLEKINEGDHVKISKSKPYSKRIHFKVIEIVKK